MKLELILKGRTETRIESNRLKSKSRVVGVAGVCPIRVEEGLEGATEGQPESAEGAEDDEREGVADNPFAQATQEHEDTTKEEVGRSSGGSATTRSSPSHQDTAKRRKRQKKANKSTASGQRNYERDQG